MNENIATKWIRIGIADEFLCSEPNIYFVSLSHKFVSFCFIFYVWLGLSDLLIYLCIGDRQTRKNENVPWNEWRHILTLLHFFLSISSFLKIFRHSLSMTSMEFTIVAFIRHFKELTEYGLSYRLIILEEKTNATMDNYALK